MKRLATFGLAGMFALAGFLLFTETSDAGRRHYHRHHHNNGITFGFSFGSPYYAPHHYRPYDYDYYYPAPVRRYHRGLPAAHVAWCYDRYRSYRVSDNTFQPYHGWRRHCRSPYW